MSDLFHLTEVAEFTEVDMQALGDMSLGTRVDHPDGSYTLLNTAGEVVGWGCPLPRGPERYHFGWKGLSNIRQL